MMTSRPVTSGHKNPLHFGLPQRLKKTREAAGVTAVHVAKLAGVSNASIHYIENGSKAARLDTVEAIARALGVEPCWLAFGQQGTSVFKLRVPGGAPLDGEPVHVQGQGPADQHACLPARLVAAREARGLSRKGLGAAAQISGQGVAYLEAGRSVGTVATIEALAVALGVSPCWLAYGVGQGPQGLR